MPQFDIILYFAMCIHVIIYISILYFIISVFVMPHFWEMYNYRYVKKETNEFYNNLYKEFSNNMVEFLNTDIKLFSRSTDFNYSRLKMKCILSEFYYFFTNFLRIINYKPLINKICSKRRLKRKLKHKFTKKILKFKKVNILKLSKKRK